MRWMIAMCALALAAPAMPADAPAAAASDQPAKTEQKGRGGWNEKVTVIGRRNLRQQFAGRTFRGSEGFADGSAPESIISRNPYSWQVYYAADGTLEARFRRFGAIKPHGPLFDKVFRERGSWRVDDGWLCQTIPAYGSGAEICYDVEFQGRRAGMYYATCGALTRCYEGRLGPEGEFFEGRQIVED